MVIFHGYVSHNQRVSRSIHATFVSHCPTLETGKEGTLREGPQWTRGPEPWVNAEKMNLENMEATSSTLPAWKHFLIFFFGGVVTLWLFVDGLANFKFHGGSFHGKLIVSHNQMVSYIINL